MAPSARSLKIGAIFEIFVISLLGFLIPVRWASESILKSDGFRILKSFSAGIIFGVGTMHLLADAIENLGEVTDYPLALAIMLLGVFLTLGLELISMHSMQQKERTLSVSIAKDPYLMNAIAHDMRLSDSGIANIVNPISAPRNPSTNITNAISQNVQQNHLLENNSADEPYHLTHRQSVDLMVHRSIETEHLRKALVKAVLLEVSVAVHSVIIGFDLGTLDEIASLEILMAAFGFHQFFEGISLGTAISETKLPEPIKLLFAFNFALTFPIGVVIGLTSTSTSSGDIVQGCANAIAAGSLIYSSLVEMIAEDFDDPDLHDRFALKMTMFVAAVMGTVAMAVLAIWA